jgi:hypothetical protein
MAFGGPYEAGPTLRQRRILHFCILKAFGKQITLHKGKAFLFMKNVNNMAARRNILVL